MNVDTIWLNVLMDPLRNSESVINSALTYARENFEEVYSVDFIIYSIYSILLLKLILKLILLTVRYTIMMLIYNGTMKY